MQNARKTLFLTQNFVPALNNVQLFEKSYGCYIITF